MAKKSLDTTNSDIPAEIPTNMDALTASDQLPEVNEAAMEAVKAQAAEVASEAPAVKLKKDGTPKKTPGRKPGAIKSQMNLKPEAKNDIPVISSAAAAATCSGLLEMTSVNLISDEWIMSEMERAANIKAWEDCFNHYGGVNLPPPAALAANYLGLIVTRSFKPKTQSKWGLIKYWFASKFKRDKNARINNRTDVIGKDDLRDKEGASPATQENKLYSS